MHLLPPTARKWLPAVVLAGGCAAVLHTSVYTDFERVRFRVVTSPQTARAGAVVVALPDLTRLAGQPAALVLRLTNAGETTREVQIAAGGEVLGEARVPPGREIQVDLSVPDGAVLADPTGVELTAAAGEWSLNYVEVANVHGYSTGLFEFHITPAARRPQRLGAVASVPAFGLLVALYGLRWRRIAHQRSRNVHAAAAVLVGSFLAAVFVLPSVSRFAVHLATHTLLVCLVVLYYPALAVLSRDVLLEFGRVLELALHATGVFLNRVYKPAGLLWGVLLYHATRAVRWVWARRYEAAWAARWVWARRIPVVYAAAIVLFGSSIAKWYEPDTGLTALIKFGERLEHRRLLSVSAIPRHIYADSVGYDGQYYAQLAVDPLLRDPGIGVALDAPAYRARRILFSWTAYLAGLGRPAWIVHAYAVQYVVFWLVLAWVLCRWFPPTSVQNLGLWLGCLFSEGLILSVLNTVPDGPGILLLALGVAAMERGRTNRAAWIVGIACLARSTNVLWSPMVVGADDVRHRVWRGVLLRGLLVAGPGAVWGAYLLLGDHGLGGFAELAGGANAHRNFGLPFSSYMAKWSTTVAELHEAGWDSYARFSLLALIGLTTQVVVLLAVRDWRNPWWRAGIGSIVLMAFLGPAVWEGHPSAVTRVLLPMVFAFNAVLPRTRWFWPLFVLGNLSLLHSLEVLGVPFWRYI